MTSARRRLPPPAPPLAHVQVSYKPFVLTVMLAASSSFITPIGYQTNTLVWGPGGYRFTDFIRIGTPLSLIYLVVGCLLVPRVFPFWNKFIKGERGKLLRRRVQSRRPPTWLSSLLCVVLSAIVRVCVVCLCFCMVRFSVASIFCAPCKLLCSAVVLFVKRPSCIW